MVLRVFNRLRVKHVEKQYAAQEGQNRMSKQNNREKFAVAQ